MTTAQELGPDQRALHVYLSVLGGLALLVVGCLLGTGASRPWSPAVLPVTALVCAAQLCPVWASTGRRRSQWLDASDVALVVAVVLLPLPVALLVHVLGALLTVLVEFRRSPVRVLYNSAHVVLTAAATGALVTWWDPTAAWLPWAAAAACFLVEQVLAQPLLLTAAALAAGDRPTWRDLLLDRPVPTVTVPLSTAVLAGLVGAAAGLLGAVLVWPTVALLCALALVSRSRLCLQSDAHRLLHAVRVMAASAGGRGTSPVLETLDAALDDVGGVSGVRVARPGERTPPGHLSAPVPSPHRGGLSLRVRRPVETSSAYGSREQAVRSLLETGARAYAVAQATHALQHDAAHDDLTGLLNRAGFLARADDELVRAGRSARAAVVAYVDLDGFKSVNDSLGHEAGDRALQVVAAELRELVRPHDVVARLGGDEFALLLLDLPTREHGERVVQRVRERLAAGWPVTPGSRLRFSGSLGTADFPEDADDLLGLLRRADARMFECKRARGRSR